ncbi:MAG: hypothetical protein K8L91_11340 [Anaerolineae bacterium]|nr:hypothetical protein [Anaerolineae bacterium]
MPIHQFSHFADEPEMQRPSPEASETAESQTTRESHLTPRKILSLQRSLGNRTVRRLLQNHVIQRETISGDLIVNGSIQAGAGLQRGAAAVSAAA